MRFVSLLLCVLLAACSPDPEGLSTSLPKISESHPTAEVTISDGLSKAERDARDVTVKISFVDGSSSYCGATVIDKRGVIVTADHCIDSKIEMIRIDGSLTRVKQVISDVSDHTILVVNRKFDKAAVIAERPGVGTGVFIWGNSRFDDLFRRGYVSGFYRVFWPDGIGTHNNMVMDMMVGGGDSGSGIFDEKGRLVGVVTGTFDWQGGNYPVVSCALEFTFTAKQLAGVVDSKHLIGK